MPPLTTIQKAMVQRFMSATGANEKTAQRFLRNANYRLDIAADTYLSSGSVDNTRVSAIEKAYDDLVDPARGDTRDVLSTETTLEYLQQNLGVDVENAEMFVAMELVQAPAMGEITRQGFVDGWKATDLTTFTKTSQKKYVRDLVARLSSDRLYFRKVYRHAFIAGKEASQKSLALDYAKIYWGILFSPPGRPWKSASRDWSALWAEFIEDKFTHSVSKDMWNMTLEFANKTMEDEALLFYNPEDSWPGVIDDFVAWYRKKYPQEDKMDED
ncbi:DUF298-domain-containing protein [Cryphonectria parasitica EP155]|uniref:Defective in cullin neddylation protein n=1 Tax=Cryphonectria parasitica (strain ATCC 38755 / EP155) TaxID=660469 RepID=A0A9P5CUZ5_CRYP1|nr:DUF298-domain-containing protein [Cryphonectria parasitica EP155]KAF3770420.1 DUF298-domain-containing protein [Cryphonectria parasitica EP155]